MAGIKPAEFWDMELWEFNNCIMAYNKMAEKTGKERLIQAWETAAFTGSAFAGKLRKLDNYVKDETATNNAPSIGKDEFEKKLKRAKGG